MLETSVSLWTVCNDGLYRLNSLNDQVDGLFAVSCQVTQSEGIRLLTPVLKNLSSEVLYFRRVFVRVLLPSGPYECYAQQSRWCHENEGGWQPMDGRGVVLSHLSGKTTNGNTPMIAFRSINGSDGMIMHVLPVGNWRIYAQMHEFSAGGESGVQVLLGISDELLNYPLAHGEEWHLPQVILHSFRDFMTSTGEFHEFLLKYLPGASGRLPPVVYNCWLEHYDSLDVSRLRQELLAASKAGCEVYIIDAGWFGSGNTAWYKCVGDWREKNDSAFYGKMKDFADEVRAAGLKFGLWIEPERFRDGVPIIMEHPEWFVSTGQPNNRMRLEIPEAYEYHKQTFLRLIDTYGVEYIKTDMNGWLGFDADGTEHNRYAACFYHLIEEIRHLRPQVFMECCAAGALRNDLEALKHFDSLFVSDNANPFEVNNTMIGGWHRLLPGKIQRWVVLRQLHDSVPTYALREGHYPVITPFGGAWDEFSCVDLESLLSANFTGGAYGFSGSLASLSPDNLEIVARYVRLFKEKREFLYHAAGYSLVDQKNLKVLQLSHDSNVILLVQYNAGDQVPQRTVRLCALIPEATYRMNDQIYSGRELMDRGVTLPLKANNSLQRQRAELFFFEPIESKE